jgi:hypothetical protein
LTPPQKKNAKKWRSVDGRREQTLPPIFLLNFSWKSDKLFISAPNPSSTPFTNPLFNAPPLSERVKKKGTGKKKEEKQRAPSNLND